MADTETLRTITTLGAVMLGFMLGQTSEWVKSKRKAKKQRISVRRLIQLETVNNISRLNRFMSSVLEKMSSDSEDGEFMYVQFADQVSRIPFPPITTEAWRANLGEVASVYDESELERMWCFQRDLEQLHSLHLFFCEAQSERMAMERLATSEYGHGALRSLIGGNRFANSVEEPAKIFKDLIDRLQSFQVTDD